MSSAGILLHTHTHTHTHIHTHIAIRQPGNQTHARTCLFVVCDGSRQPSNVMISFDVPLLLLLSSWYIATIACAKICLDRKIDQTK